MATLPSFRTWTAGEIVVASYMNSNVRDAGNFFLSMPVFEGRQTVAQSIANGTPAALTWDTEDIDTDNGHSTVTNTSRYTPATAARFQLSAGVGWASNATGYRTGELWKNGVVLNGGGTVLPAVNGAQSRFPTRTMTTTANGTSDYVEVWVNQTSGGALLTAVGGIDQPTFSVRMVGTT